MLRSSAQQCSRQLGAPSRLLVSMSKPNWRRWYSMKIDDASLENLPRIDPSKLSITKTVTPKELVPPEELVFGRTFTGRGYVLLLCPHARLTIFLFRPHALNRMDSIRRMACPKNNTVSESLPRSGNLRISLRFRMFRRHEGIQVRRWLNSSVPTRQEHGKAQQVGCTNSTSHRQW